jgi:hypothetical protein
MVGGGMFSGNSQVFTDTDAVNHPGRFYTVRLK